MNNSKIRVAVIFGGQSAEHEVSLQSAKNVIESLDRAKYEVILIGIDKQGKWYINDNSEFLLNASDPKAIKLSQSSLEVAVTPGIQSNKLISKDSSSSINNIDVVFPILHGPLGEDGTMQGLLELLNVPYVGSGVLGSAVCMDKDITKKLLSVAGLPVCKYITLKKHHIIPSYKDIKATLGTTLFIKPANLGSSVGISKVNNEQEYQKAIDLAFSFDNKILIEEAIRCREIEVAVLGNENPEASVAGEIISKDNFYSYDNKYIDAEGAKLVIPADISDSALKNIQTLAIKAFTALECRDFARCDFFLCDNDQVIINEINTIPGFTNISMYPKLWGASGLAYSELVSKLIDMALTRKCKVV